MRIRDIDGKPVIDAKRRITLTITAADIKRADLKEPHNCAVARACRRELNAEEARVHLSRVYIRTTGGSWTRYQTPKAMRSEIIAFDRGGKFEPSSFVLLPPPPSQKAGKRQGSVAFKKGAGKKRRPHHVVSDVRLGPA